MPGARDQLIGLVQELADVPQVTIPDGRWLELPGRGRTWLTDVPGPQPDSPTVLLLHAVGCTGMLTWFPAIEPLSERVPRACSSDCATVSFFSVGTSGSSE